MTEQTDFWKDDTWLRCTLKPIRRIAQLKYCSSTHLVDRSDSFVFFMTSICRTGAWNGMSWKKKTLCTRTPFFFVPLRSRRSLLWTLLAEILNLLRKLHKSKQDLDRAAWAGASARRSCQYDYERQQDYDIGTVVCAGQVSPFGFGLMARR